MSGDYGFLVFLIRPIYGHVVCNVVTLKQSKACVKSPVRNGNGPDASPEAFGRTFSPGIDWFDHCDEGGLCALSLAMKREMKKNPRVRGFFHVVSLRSASFYLQLYLRGEDDH